MASLNKVQLIGRLGKDPETKSTDNGNTLTKFSLAVDESYKNKDGEKVDKVEWVNIVLWGKVAEIAAKYLKKGSQCYLEGKITSRSWENNEGETRYITEIVVNQLILLGDPKGDGERKSSPEEKKGGNTKAPSTPRPATKADPINGDDIPF